MKRVLHNQAAIPDEMHTAVDDAERGLSPTCSLSSSAAA